MDEPKKSKPNIIILNLLKHKADWTQLKTENFAGSMITWVVLIFFLPNFLQIWVKMKIHLK